MIVSNKKVEIFKNKQTIIQAMQAIFTGYIIQRKAWNSNCIVYKGTYKGRPNHEQPLIANLHNDVSLYAPLYEDYLANDWIIMYDNDN